MKVEMVNPVMQVPDRNIINAADRDFFQVLHAAYGTKTNKELQNKTQQFYGRVQCGIYKKDSIDISKCPKTGIDTGRYQIQEKDGNVTVYDKQIQENFGWILRYGAEVQVDEKSGQKFLINDLGNGFFMMQYVDGELENGLKEFFALDELPEKEMDHFTVQTDTATGIQYITANGYEWQGGQIIFTDGARRKLNALAETYMREYPGRLKSYDEAFFYASFEVRGLARRTSNGILMLGQNNVTFKGKDENNDWTIFFDMQLWEIVKRIFVSESTEDLANQASWQARLAKLNVS